MAKQMSAAERRAWHEQAIREGGSVLHENTIITQRHMLPTIGQLAKTPDEKRAARQDILARARAIEQEALDAGMRLGSPDDDFEEPGEGAESAGEGSARGDEGILPETFPGYEALMEAGYTTFATVDSLTEEELTQIKGIGPATAKKIVDELG